MSTYTCYGCHEHQPARIEKRHRGMVNITNCVKCHPTGRGNERRRGQVDGPQLELVVHHPAPLAVLSPPPYQKLLQQLGAERLFVGMTRLPDQPRPTGQGPRDILSTPRFAVSPQIAPHAVYVPEFRPGRTLAVLPSQRSGRAEPDWMQLERLLSELSSREGSIPSRGGHCPAGNGPMLGSWSGSCPHVGTD
jgi:hypothetical protein